MEGQRPGADEVIERGDLVRVGDGTEEARVESVAGEEIRLRYPSGARRTVESRNLARPSEPTRTERELLRDLLAAGDGGLERPGYRWRVAIVALLSAGYIVEERRTLILTTQGEQAARRLAA